MGAAAATPTSPMDFLKPRVLRARQQALALLVPCLAPVRDELGNVPVAMQADAFVNGCMTGLCERCCAALGLTRTAAVRGVTARVFEEIYRREATRVLTACDRLEAQADAAFCGARERLRAVAPAAPDPAWTAELSAHVGAHYERPDTRVL